MSKPDFIIAGFNRSGTSTLQALLKQHPDIFMSTPKEIHFFDRNENFKKGKKWYESHFINASKNQIKGEATPSYIFKGIIFEKHITDYIYAPDDDSIIRMAALYPDMKLIVSIRHPVHTAKSHMERTRLKGLEDINTTLENAFHEELAGQRHIEKTYLCYHYLTDYALHIKHLLAYFPRNQILFLKFENWTENQQMALDQISSFLNIPRHALNKDHSLHYNSGRSYRFTAIAHLLKNYLYNQNVHRILRRTNMKKGYEPLPSQSKDFLENLYADKIQELKAITGLDFSDWNIPLPNKNL